MSTFNLSLNHHLDLPDDVFRLMRDQIYKRTGMWFADTSKYLLQKRLSPRARELNFESFQKYFYFLQYDPRAEAEFDQIYDLVTTNETYFFREPAQLAAFADEIRNRVSFGRLNLYDEPRVSVLGHLDVIFCRNVIIYFDDQSKKVVVSNFYNRLTDSGYLLLGHSESLISLSTQFKLRHLKNDMVYQK